MWELSASEKNSKLTELIIQNAQLIEKERPDFLYDFDESRKT